MKPTSEEIDAAISEEADAMKEFARASSVETKASFRVKAARSRLMRARAEKSAVVRDLMMYSK